MNVSPRSQAPPTGPRIPLRHVRCPLCHEDDAEPLLWGRDLWHGLPGRHRVVRCRRCGMRYQDPQPVPEALHLCYPADYQAYRPRDDARRARADRRLSRRVMRRLQEAALRCCRGYPGRRPWWGWLVWPALRLTRHSDRLIPFRPPGRLLDVGCGAGAFLQNMRRLGWQVRGVEMDEATARVAGEERGLDVLAGDVFHPDLPVGGFDAVTFWHVLEHVPEPRATLARARALLRPGGILAVQVPNSGGCCARLFGADWLGLDVPRHLTQFSDRTLRQMLRQAGFRVSRVRPERLADGWKWSIRRRWPRARWLQRRKHLWRLAADVAALLGLADCVTAVAERPRRTRIEGRV